MDAFIESDRRSAHRFQSHCAGHIRQERNSFSSMQRQTTDGGHRLGAVEKRDAFLYFELDRFDLRAMQSFPARQPFAAKESFALADNGQCQMREWGEITARSDRTFLGNPRGASPVDHPDKGVN